MTSKKRIGCALVAAALVTMTAACGSDDGEAGAGGTCEFGPADDAAWSQTLEDAVDEGQVNWYHIFAPDQGARVIEAFNEVCPGVEVVPTATGKALLPLVESQIANGGDGADVFVWGDEEWFKANADEMAELSGPSSSAWPEDSWFVPGKVSQVFTLPIGVIAWNTQEFPDGFESFEELTAPEVQGRLGTREDVTTSYIGFLRYLSEKYGESYLEDLAAQDPKFYPSAYVIPNGLASGEIGVANTTAAAAVVALMDKGAPIDYTIPADSYSVPSTMGVLADAKRPAAGNVFAEFLLSEEGQGALVGEGEGGSALDVEGALDLSGNDVLEASTVTDEVRAEWTEKFDQIFLQ